MVQPKAISFAEHEPGWLLEPGKELGAAEQAASLGVVPLRFCLKVKLVQDITMSWHK